MDINAIQQVLGLAGVRLSSVGTAADLAAKIKGMIQGPQPGVPQEVQTLLGDLVSQIAMTKAINADLQIKLSNLSLELQREDEARAKLGRYELRRTQGGDMVWALKADAANSEPEHFICPRCYEDGVRSILQRYGFSKDSLECKVCGQKLQVGEPTLDRLFRSL